MTLCQGVMRRPMDRQVLCKRWLSLQARPALLSAKEERPSNSYRWEYLYITMMLAVYTITKICSLNWINLVCVCNQSDKPLLENLRSGLELKWFLFKMDPSRLTLINPCASLETPTKCRYCFYASGPVKAVAECIMFSGCPYIRPILVNAVSQVCLEGISSNVEQTSTWSQRRTD